MKVQDLVYVSSGRELFSFFLSIAMENCALVLLCIVLRNLAALRSSRGYYFAPYKLTVVL